MRRWLTEREQVDIVTAFTEQLEPVASIAERYNMSRHGIYGVLHRNGVETPKESKIAVSCSACGAELLRKRGKVRSTKNHFCGHDCHYAFLEAKQGGTFKYWRNGSRIAREVASRYFDLQPGHIVHHRDRSSFNNNIDNLMVFANQGDHIRFHRLGPDYVRPLFDGKGLI